MEDSFILDIIARLNKELSRRAIDGDLKSLDDTMYVKVLAKLSTSLAAKEIKRQLDALDGLYVNVGIRAGEGARDEIQKTIHALQQSIDDIEIGLEASKSQQRKLATQIEGIRNNAQRQAGSKPLEFNLQVKKDKLISDIEYTGKRFSKLFSSDSAAKKYGEMMRRAMSVTDKGQLADARAELAAFTSEMKASGLATRSTGDRWRDLTARAKDLFSAASVVRVAFSQMREAVSTAVDLDKAYTDLVKVQSELTRGDYPDYLDRCSRKAQELATTQKALIEGAEEFSKSGYDLKTSNALTEKSTVLSNVGEMSASDSAKAIISGVQAYDAVDGYTDAVDKAGALIDKYNELGNTASITTKELAQGVQSVGSVLADANTGVDQFLSLLSAGNRQYQNADALALALRTSALRIRGATVELEEAGEDVEGVMSALDNQKTIKALTGVDILESDQQTIRSIYDIFLDISKVYKDMSDVDQSALLEIISGKHRASAISATLNNMTEAETILQNSLNAAGSAQKEYDTYLESTEAHLQRFQAKLVETYSNFVDGSMVSHVADLGTAILDLVNKTDLLKHSLISIAAIKIGKGIVTVGGAVSGAVTQMNTLGNALQQVRNLPVDNILREKSLKGIGEATKDLTDKNLKLLLSQRQLEENDRAIILSKHNLTEEQAKEKLETLGLTTATNANTTANTANAASTNTMKGALTGLTASAKAAWAAMSTLQKVSIIFAAVSTAWSIGSSIVNGIKQDNEELIQSTKDAANTYSESSSSINDYISRYKDLQEALAAAKGNEQETYNVKKQLLELQTEINEKFGEAHGTLNLLTGDYDSCTEAIKRLNKEAANAFLNENMAGIRAAEEKMTKLRNYALSYGEISGSTEKGEALREVAERYSDQGLFLNEMDNGQFSIHLKADAQSAYDTINAFEGDLRDKAKEIGDESLFDDVLSLSSDSLNDAKEVIDEYGDIYRKSLAAEIATDDGKSVKYNEALEAVEAFNESVLSSEDIYNDKNVEEARQSLQGIKEELSGEEWEKYGALIEDVFDQADTRLLDFNEQLGNDDSLKKLAEGLKGLDDIDLRAFDEAVGTNNSFDRLKESAESYGLSIDDLIDTLVRLGYVQTQASEGTEDVALSFKDKFQNLWDSEPFSDARKDLAKLAKEAGITEIDIQSLASENSGLASLLNESGMSAQFAATCFNKMSNGVDGFSSITDDALALDKALHGMDESLQNVAASKSTYDKAMEQDDYNAEFEDYQEAYKNAMQMFEDGDYGRHFRSTMEYFLGEDSYSMSIEELYSAMKNLKGVFGEGGTNGLEFLDKLYEKKDILDGMDSSLTKLSDGSYDFDLKPDEFEKIGEALGMTAEEVAACTNALGMFGDFHSYDLDEVEKALNGISIAAKDGGKSILSMQGVEKILADIGYNGYEVYHIMQDINGMDSIQMLDFGADDAESIQAVINKLKELNMVEVNGDSINVSGLIESLHGSLGMAADDINAFLENINGKFQFTDAEGSLATLEQAKTMALQAEDEGAKEGVDRLGESARATDEDISRLHEDMERMNALNMQGLVTQFGNVGAKVDELGNKVRTVAGQMEGLNSGTATIPMLAGSKGQNASPGGKGQKPGKGQAHSKGTVGNAYAKGYDGLPKDERGALRSEYGQRELTVYPNGTYEVTDTPTIDDLPKGTVIFNEGQTERILRGAPHGAFGSAYAGGTAGGANPATGKSYRDSGNANASNKESKKAAEEKTKEEKEQFEEVFDWIERRIEKFRRLFDKWVKQAETAVTSGFVTKYYKKAANAVKKELSTYGKAYSRYMKEANAVGLDERYAKKVRNGTIDIETIRAEGSKEDVAKHEELADKIQKYQEYYNKAIESTTSFVETAEELYNLPLDKAATKIEKFKDAIDLLDKKLDNAIGSKAKNKLVDKQTKQEQKTLDAEKLARKESRKGLNAARKALTKSGTLRSPDVSKEDRKKIKNATKNNKEVNLSLFKEGSKAYNAAVKYNEALKANKKATYECSVAQQEYNSWLVEASKLKFDNIADGYEKKVQMIGHEMDALDRRISEIEASGKNVDRLYYESQKKVNGRTLAQYQAEKAALEESLKGIKKGTDEWHDAYDQIQQVESAISDCVKETYDLNNAINQLHFDLFDEVSESIDRIVTEQEFLRGLFAHEKGADSKTGGFTEAGVAELGSLSASYHASKNKADRDEALLKELQNVKERGRQANGHYVLGDWEFNSLEDLQKKIDETYTKWQGDIKDTYSLETEIAGLMKERYQAELDMMKELIDAKKEALDSEKDLHDYQRSISEKTKSVSTIQKQIAAYSGDTSEEGMSRLQKLQKELDDAKDGLKEAEYDRYVSDQKDMLDGLYKEYEDRTLEKTEDFMGLVQEGLGISNDNTALIAGYLETIAKQNGYKIETTGVPGTSGDIKKDVDGAISDKADMKEAQSGTSSMPTGRTQPAAHEWGQPDGGQLMQAGGGVHKLHSAESDREAASDYIKKNARKAKKKKKEYADVNQRIFENKAKAYDGTGKVLPSDGLKGLAKKIGVEYDGAKKSDSLYKKLKSIKLPGFKKGGIARLIKENGEDGVTLARNGEGFIAPEHMGPIQELVESAPKINELLKVERDESRKPIAVNGVELIPVKTDLMRAFEALTPERRMEMFGIAPPPITTSPSSGMPAPNQSITSNVNNVVNVDNITLPSVKDADEFCDYMFRKSQKSNNYKGFIKDLIGGAMKGHREPVFRPHL